MGLWMWDQSGDPYNHEQLASNFARLDTHDHTNGRGVQLTTQSIAPGSIDKTLLGIESVQLTNLNSELQAKLKGEIATEGIANGAITTEKIATGALTTIKYALESITEAKLDPTVKAKLTEATTAKSELTTLKGVAITTTSPATKYIARAESFSKGSLASGESATWTNPSSTRPAWVNLDFTVHSENSRSMEAKVLVGGVLVNEVTAVENNGTYQIASTGGYWVAPSEVVTITAAASGGSTKVNNINISYRLL